MSAARFLEDVRKGKGRTLWEDEALNNVLRRLSTVSEAICDGAPREYGNETVVLTAKQRTFVQCVLPHAIRCDCPHLGDVMKVFDLTLDTRFVFV